MERYLQLGIAHELDIGMCVIRSATAMAEFVDGILFTKFMQKYDSSATVTLQTGNNIDGYRACNIGK